MQFVTDEEPPAPDMEENETEFRNDSMSIRPTTGSLVSSIRPATASLEYPKARFERENGVHDMDKLQLEGGISGLINPSAYHSCRKNKRY